MRLRFDAHIPIQINTYVYIFIYTGIYEQLDIVQIALLHFDRQLQFIDY